MSVPQMRFTGRMLGAGAGSDEIDLDSWPSWFNRQQAAIHRHAFNAAPDENFELPRPEPQSLEAAEHRDIFDAAFRDRRR